MGGCAETDFLEVDTVVGVGASAGLAGQTCDGEAVSSGSIAGGRGETDFLELDTVLGVGSGADAAGQAGSSAVCRMQGALCLNS